jgi:hypothetical protein
MNESSAILALEQNRKSGGFRELLALVGLPSNSAERDMSESAVKILHAIKSILDGLLLQAIEKKTAAEFKETREEVFFKYFEAILSVSKLARVIVPQATIDRLTWESFSEAEADLRNEGLSRFGATARDQAFFTVWTLRKINALISRIAAAPPLADEHKLLDRKLVAEFSFYSAWSQFHLDCLIASIRFDKPINPGLLDEISDGLRSAVNAYGLIHQAVGLREHAEVSALQAYAWDEEDQELMESSMREIEPGL